MYKLIEINSGSATVATHLLGVGAPIGSYAYAQWQQRCALERLCHAAGFYGPPAHVTLTDATPWPFIVSKVMDRYMVGKVLDRYLEMCLDPRRTFASVAGWPMPSDLASQAAEALFLSTLKCNMRVRVIADAWYAGKFPNDKKWQERLDMAGRKLQELKAALNDPMSPVSLRMKTGGFAYISNIRCDAVSACASLVDQVNSNTLVILHLPFERQRSAHYWRNHLQPILDRDAKVIILDSKTRAEVAPKGMYAVDINQFRAARVWRNVAPRYAFTNFEVSNDESSNV